jgi:hypothetical protein
VADVTVAGTEIAMDAVAGFGFPPKSFVEGGGFLKDVEIGHEARPDKTIIRVYAHGREWAWLAWVADGWLRSFASLRGCD